jgi:hypothetical protein
VITAAEAQTLIDALKESVRTDVFEWLHATPQDEKFVEAANDKNRFILHLKRNPFEIRLHFRSLDRHVDLMRIDAARRHVNPDGTEIVGQPHLHVFREGYERLPWAEPIDWMDLAHPMITLERFLDELHARFQAGIQLGLDI